MNISGSCFWATSPGEPAGADRSAPVPELLGAVPILVHVLHKAGLSGGPQPHVQSGAVSGGAGSIPSDTACFPAKLAHGHIEFLAKLGVDAIFYPCMTYNIDEGLGQNHYNCPVVAYYPEVLAGNCECLKNTKFIYDYVGIHRPKDFEKKMTAVMEREFGPIPHGEIKAAVEAAYARI